MLACVCVYVVCVCSIYIYVCMCVSVYVTGPSINSKGSKYEVDGVDWGSRGLIEGRGGKEEDHDECLSLHTRGCREVCGRTETASILHVYKIQ